MPYVRRTKRRSYDAPLRFARVWGAALGTAAALLALAILRERPPQPTPDTAPDSVFSAARAWPIMSYLADTVGYRVTGTPSADSAARRLLSVVRGIPGVDATIQDVTGTTGRGGHVTAFRTRNVIARLAGRDSTDTADVLISAHYDSPVESVGASDDAGSVAVVVEMLRALAAGQRPRHGVIVNINGAEEQGLLGARGFMQHPWMRRVRAFIDLESAGPGGRAILFQSGPGDAWIARAYAHAAPYPFGSVIAQDIFQSGAVPSGTDFAVYRTAGVPGLDVAFYRDGWKYHTQLDRTWYVQPGSLQQMGSNTLATVRALANGALPGHVSTASSVYFDVLGLFMIAYDATWAAALALLAALAGGIAIALVIRSFRFTAAELVAGLVTQIAGIAAAVAIPVGLAMAVAGPLDSPNAWYAHPYNAYLAFSALALCGMLIVHTPFHRWRSMQPVDRSEGRAILSWVAGHALLLFALLLLTVWNIGSAYLLLWWLFPSTIGLVILAVSEGRRWTLAAWIAFLPGALVSLQLANMLLGLFVPIAGRAGDSRPYDPILAGMLAACAVLVALLPVSLAHRARHVGVAAAGAAVTGLAALTVSTLTFPYTLSRPQRLAIVHEQIGDSATVRVTSAGYDSPQAAMTAVRDAQSLPPSDMFRAAIGVLAPPTGFAPPDLRVLSQRTDRGTDGGDDDAVTRTVDVRIPASDAYMLVLRVPAARLAGWSLSDSVGRRTSADSVYTARFVAAPDTGWRFTMRLRGRAPVAVELAAVRAAVTPAAKDMMVKLAPWADVHAVAVNRRRFSF